MLASSLLLTAHGHAPYILGGKLARDLTVDICIPHYYGEIQRQILRTELPDIADRVFISESLGDLLKPLLRDKRFSPDFKTYAENVKTNINNISKKLEHLYQNGIDAISLSGAVKNFTYFDLSINTGLPVFSPITPTFYVFVGKMSAIYDLSPFQSEEVQTLAKIWKEVEASFSSMFVPRLNSLYQQEYDTTGLTFTPPFAKPYALDNTPIPENTTLVIASGTGMDVDALSKLAESSSNPHTLNESPEKMLFPRVPSSAWGNPNVSAVLARSGLGSVWQAVVNQKPIGVLPGNAKIDPEIYHNSNLVKNAGIGSIVENDISQFLANLKVYKDKINEHLDIEKKEFNTNDGFEYVISQVLEGKNI